MSIPSKFSSNGLSIQVSRPIIQGGEYIDNYEDIVSSYTHNISVDGGYVSAEFNISGNNEFIEDWLQNGLDRDIKVYGSHQEVIWEGFVNEISAVMGGVSYSRGPLLSIINRILVEYTPSITAVSPPVTGTNMETTIAEDLDSQERFGVWEGVISGGTIEGDDMLEIIAQAELIRDVALNDSAYPEGIPSITISGGTGNLSATISCRGYKDKLSYVYNNPTDPPVSIYASDKIIAVLGDDPNNIISTNYMNIAENMVLVPNYEDSNRLAKTIIDEIVSLGGGTDDRWMFGVYKNRMASYQPIPDTIEYIYYKTGINQQIETVSGSVLEPWNVVPGKWVFIPTFLTSFSFGEGINRNDPRIFFAEEVNYTAPDQVVISGSKIRRLPQLLAKLGLSSAQ